MMRKRHTRRPPEARDETGTVRRETLATRARHVAEAVRDRIHDAIDPRHDPDDEARQAMAASAREVARAMAAVDAGIAATTGAATHAHHHVAAETERLLHDAQRATDEAVAEAERAFRHVAYPKG